MGAVVVKHTEETSNCFLAASVLENVKKFFNVQNHKIIFEKFAVDGKLSEEDFALALQDLGLDSKHLFKEADIDGNGFLDFETFGRIISRPSKLEQWLNTLPLAKLLAFCLQSGNECLATAPDPVRVVCSLDKSVLSTIVDGFCEGAKRLLMENAQSMSKCYAALDRKAQEAQDGSRSSAKFQTFTMSAGTAEHFHKGMTDRIGEQAAICLQAR